MQTHDYSSNKTIEMPLRITRRFEVASCGKTHSLQYQPCDPNIKKTWIHFIFN